MTESEDSIIGQITRARQQLAAGHISSQSGAGCKISLAASTGGRCRVSDTEKRSKDQTYVSVHQLAVVLHLVSAVLVGDVSLLGVLVNVGGQLLPLVGGEKTKHAELVQSKQLPLTICFFRPGDKKEQALHYYRDYNNDILI